MSDKSACGAPDTVNVVLAGSLGLVAAAIAIVAAVTGSSILAIVVGVIALILAAMTAWLSQMRRNLTRELQGAQTDVARLEAALGDQAKARVESETTAPAAERPAVATTETGAPDSMTGVEQSMTGVERLGAEVMATPPPGDLNDPDTGLLGEQYFHITLDGRVASARRHLRPLSLILIDAIEGLDDNSPHNADPSIVAGIVVETLRDADIVCRLTDGRFALILEDTPENGAIWTVERIRRRINEEFDHVTVYTSKRWVRQRSAARSIWSALGMLWLSQVGRFSPR